MLQEKDLAKAKNTNDIRIILQPYLLFRAAISFKNNKKIHLYGHEHSCTYNQVLTGFVSSIDLNAEKGYTDLIKYIQGKAKAGFIKSAKIYGRSVPGQPFDTLHRNWYGGDWEEINDPVIPAENNIRSLHFQISNGRIQLLEHAPDPLPDFKEEIKNNLL